MIAMISWSQHVNYTAHVGSAVDVVLPSGPISVHDISNEMLEIPDTGHMSSCSSDAENMSSFSSNAEDISF